MIVLTHKSKYNICKEVIIMVLYHGSIEIRDIIADKRRENVYHILNARGAGAIEDNALVYLSNIGV